MFIDTHGHIQFNAYKEDGDAVVKRAFDAGVAIIAPASQIDTSRRAVEYAERWNTPWLRAAIGLHPIHLEDVRVDSSEVGDQFKFRTRKEEFDRGKYEELLQSETVVAIGEIGLDYWRRPKSKVKRAEYEGRQKEAFIAQLDMAADHNLPVILHCRVAHDDMLAIVSEHPHRSKMEYPGVVHSYTGDLVQLEKFLSLGFSIGVNGLLFKLPFVEEAVKAAPLDRIVLETDAPYLTPPIPTGTRQQMEEAGQDPERNEPMNLPIIASRIAELKGLSLEEVEGVTTENAIRIFGLKGIKEGEGVDN